MMTSQITIRHVHSKQMSTGEELDDQVALEVLVCEKSTDAPDDALLRCVGKRSLLKIVFQQIVAQLDNRPEWHQHFLVTPTDDILALYPKDEFVKDWQERPSVHNPFAIAQPSSVSSNTGSAVSMYDDLPLEDKEEETRPKNAKEPETKTHDGNILSMLLSNDEDSDNDKEEEPHQNNQLKEEGEAEDSDHEERDDKESKPTQESALVLAQEGASNNNDNNDDDKNNTGDKVSHHFFDRHGMLICNFLFTW